MLQRAIANPYTHLLWDSAVSHPQHELIPKHKERAEIHFKGSFEDIFCLVGLRKGTLFPKS